MKSNYIEGYLTKNNMSASKGKKGSFKINDKLLLLVNNKVNCSGNKKC